MVFEDVETQYGNNRYEIKLYGPFGEKEVRNQYLTLDKSALAQGEMAYNFYGLDDSRRLINNQSQDSFSLNNTGASVSYGITDYWLMGFNYTSRKESSAQNEQLFTLKNSLAFPGLLFNNEISLQADHGYAQTTSLSGNAFGQDTFNFVVESSDDYQSDRIHSANIKRQFADFSYSGNANPWHYSVGGSYLDRENNKSWQARNIMSRYIAGINFSNSLLYNQSIFDKNTATSWNGTLVAAGSLSQAIRMSAAIDYRPDQSKLIQNGSVTIGWHDDLDLYHNLRGIYNFQHPSNQWQLNYNLSWSSDQFQLQLSTNYDEQSNWSVGLGVRFFLGYDHHNEKIIFSNQLSSNSATLNSHSYLDRNPNGWRDEGDLDLAGVKFTGIPAWSELASGDKGRTILPGVSTNTPFKFNAHWEYGTKAVASNFLIYTHPGAYIDVNMPFYVTSDFSGFVFKVNYHNEQSPLIGVLFELLDNNDKVVAITSSDVDGYYQFSNLTPGNYQVRIAPEYLNQSGYTGSTIGYQFSTPSTGGIINLPMLTIKKRPTNQKKQAELIRLVDINGLDREANVWLDTDHQHYGKVYSLASSGDYSTQKKAVGPDALPDTPTTRTILPVQPEHRAQLPNQPAVRTNSPLAPITRSRLPVQPIVRSSSPLTPMTRAQLPVQPITRSNSPIQPIVRAVLPMELSTYKQANHTDSVERTKNLAVIEKLNGDNAAPVNGERESTILASPDNIVFTLQLGVFSTNAAAKAMLDELKALPGSAFVYPDNGKDKPLFRIFIGKFQSHQQALSYQKNSLPLAINSFIRSMPKQSTIDSSQELVKAQVKSNSVFTKSYVIQLVAGQNKSKVLASATSITSIGEVFFAEKKVNGKIWYCLISQRFNNKERAQQHLEASGRSAWLVSQAEFNNITSLNNT